MLSIDIGLCSPETKRQETGLSATNVGSLSPLKGFAGQSPTVRAIDDHESPSQRYTADELQLSEKDEKDEEDSSQSFRSKTDSKVEEIKDDDDSVNELGVEEIEAV